MKRYFASFNKPFFVTRDSLCLTRFTKLHALEIKLAPFGFGYRPNVKK